MLKLYSILIGAHQIEKRKTKYQFHMGHMTYGIHRTVVVGSILISLSNRLMVVITVQNSTTRFLVKKLGGGVQSKNCQKIPSTTLLWYPFAKSKDIRIIGHSFHSLLRSFHSCTGRPPCNCRGRSG